MGNAEKLAPPVSRKRFAGPLWGAASALFWILVWTGAAAAVGNPLLLPSPLLTAQRLISLAAGRDFWKITLHSLLRIVAGTVCGIAAGMLLAVPAAVFEPFDRIFSPFVSVIRSTPVASFIILVMLWMKALLPSFISFLMVMPVVYSNFRTGLRSVDPDHVRMARQFRLPFPQKVLRIYLPSTLPFLRPAVSTSLGLAWKAGIAAEVLSFFPVSIGRQLSSAKNELETADLFAWTLTVILLSVLLEFLVRKLFAAKKGGPSANKEEPRDNT
jgi:NitT/TauT family transport system permease protein